MLAGLVTGGRDGTVGVTVALAERAGGEVPGATRLPTVITRLPDPLVLQTTHQYIGTGTGTY